MKKIIIATLHAWNIRNAKVLKKRFPQVSIISSADQLTFRRVSRLSPDYIFFPHWSWKIPQEIFANFNCIAFHMTDLPFGRGGSPLQNLIARGISKTKISALKVTEELDAGPIYMKYPLSLNGSAQEIYYRASEIIFSKMIPSIIKKSPEAKSQSGKVTIFRRRKPTDSQIYQISNLEKLYDHIRMLDAEGYPHAFIENENFIFTFKNAKQTDGKILATALISRKS